MSLMEHFCVLSVVSVYGEILSGLVVILVCSGNSVDPPSTFFGLDRFNPIAQVVWVFVRVGWFLQILLRYGMG